MCAEKAGASGPECLPRGLCRVQARPAAAGVQPARGCVSGGCRVVCALSSRSGCHSQPHSPSVCRCAVCLRASAYLTPVLALDQCLHACGICKVPLTAAKPCHACSEVGERLQHGVAGIQFPKLALLLRYLVFTHRLLKTQSEGSARQSCAEGCPEVEELLGKLLSEDRDPAPFPPEFDPLSGQVRCPY